MEKELPGLTLNDHFYSVPELIRFCWEEIRRKTSPVWKQEIYSFILEFINEDEFILQKTSGTTGKPKTIRLLKKSMLASAENTIAFFGLKRSQVAVLCLPVRYIAGKMMVVRAMLARMNLILTEPKATPDFSEIDKIDFCAMVPMQAAGILKRNLWPRIKILILGGAETNPGLIRQLRAVSTQVYETYGMAETCSHVALRHLNGRHPEAFFFALPGVSFSTDRRGCLIIQAPYLPEKTITNDCVELAAGNRFRWLGRFDNVINSGGIKIQPETLEKQIQEILRIPCAVISQPDELLGQKTILILETEKENCTPDQILASLAPHIDKKILPKSFRYIKRLPRNKSFKIDRVQLKKWNTDITDSKDLNH